MQQYKRESNRNIGGFPLEIWFEIIQKLKSPRDITVCSLACKLLNQLSNDDKIWKPLCLRFVQDLQTKHQISIKLFLDVTQPLPDELAIIEKNSNQPKWKLICQHRVQCLRMLKKDAARKVAGFGKYSPVKIVVAGASKTGKTTLVKRYGHLPISGTYSRTVGVDAHHGLMYEDYSTFIRLQFWDVAGTSLDSTSLYYARAQGLIVFFDRNNKESLLQVPQWNSPASFRDGPPCARVLIVNTIDDKKTKHQGVPEVILDGKEMDEFCAKHDFDAWFEDKEDPLAALTDAMMFIGRELHRGKKFEELEDEKNNPRVREQPSYGPAPGCSMM